MSRCNEGKQQYFPVRGLGVWFAAPVAWHLGGVTGRWHGGGRALGSQGGGLQIGSLVGLFLPRRKKTTARARPTDLGQNFVPSRHDWPQPGKCLPQWGFCPSGRVWPANRAKSQSCICANKPLAFVVVQPQRQHILCFIAQILHIPSTLLSTGVAVWPAHPAGNPR